MTSADTPHPAANDSTASDHAPAPYEPIEWRDGRLWLLDQTLLPERVAVVPIDSLEAAAEAITTMRVRGAPAIGITAAYALAVVARRQPAEGADAVVAAVERAAPVLAATRPTAVNLRWAVDRVVRVLRRLRSGGAAPLAEVADPRSVVLDEALLIHAEQRAADRRMAEAGASLVPARATVLTHCNTGPLATGGGGTALGVIIHAHRRGRVAAVLVDETRPRLQGLRLTAWELAQHAVPHHVIADGAAASLMAAGRVQAVFTGADRIAANGDAANKIGTYALAIVAAHHDVPFHVVAPLSTVDPAAAGGSAIPVEQRDEQEVLTIAGQTLAPAGTRALNPAFDVTPAELIASIVTEQGVLRAPYERSIADALASAGTQAAE